MRKYKVAVLPGDGIGREVVPESLRVLETAMALTSGLYLEFYNFDCGGEYFQSHGREWSEDAEEFTKKEADAILLGAVGGIDSSGNTIRRPDGHLAGYSIVIGLRTELELYANVRPVKLYQGVPTPLANKDHHHIDMIMVRENTEGLYAPQQAPARSQTEEVVIDKRVISRKGSLRVSEFAFELARKSDGAPTDGIRRVTCVDKSNLLAGCQLFRRCYNEVGEKFPDIERDYAYVDAFAQWVIRKPEYYNVVVAPNSFGDIITDLGAAIQGGLGMAPAGSIGDNHAVFEPVHGSAPKYYGKKVSNPLASILSSKMMLQWLGEKHGDANAMNAAALIERGIVELLKEGKVRTYDLCADKWKSVTPSSTTQVTDRLVRIMKESVDDRT